MQFSTTLRNARLDAIPTTVGNAPLLNLYSGSAPADCATADSGTLLVSLTLPSTWLNAAAAGAIGKAGTWSGTAAVTGTLGYFRLKDATGTTTYVQGSVGLSGANPDLVMDAPGVTAGQTITIPGFVINEANA